MLADIMKERTWALHSEAERTGVVSDMLKGALTRPSYLCFLQNLLPVYEALEARPEALFPFPALQDAFGEHLFRAPSLRADMSYITNAADELEPVIFEDTRTYCAAITRASLAKSPAIIGHIYVRYLGDLNGGQILKRLVGEGLGLSPEALTFYDYTDVQDIVGFRQTFREAFNALALTSIETEIAVQGARDAFSWNIKISNAVKESYTA